MTHHEQHDGCKRLVLKVQQSMQARPALRQNLRSGKRALEGALVRHGAPARTDTEYCSAAFKLGTKPSAAASSK
jgi:hypothetical protein